MTHVRTSPYYPQSNGKIERWHKSLKGECIRPGTPLTKQDARQLIQQYVDHYNTVRLHSAVGFVTPADMLAGRQAQIHEARDRVPVQREMERGRSPLVSIPPMRGLDFQGMRVYRSDVCFGKSAKGNFRAPTTSSR